MHLAFFRAAIDSAWKVGVSRRLWKGQRGGDLLLLVVGWAVIGSALEARPSVVRDRGFRKSLAWMRGDGFVDLVEVAAKRRAKTKPGDVA